MMPARIDTGDTPRRRVWAWGVIVLVLAAAPWVFHQGYAITLLSHVCALSVLALSYNLLLGQTGLLSFGHAVYAGLGGFFAVHAMNLAGAGHLVLPVTLVPLVGGVAGAAFGALFGYLSTRRSGTPFAMISLGIGELVHAVGLMFPGFFGGEGGVSTNRMIGEPVLGVSYGPDVQVYYLIAAWSLLAMLAMAAFVHTPLGRLANAVRDNARRVGFIGYDAHGVRCRVMTVAAFFAGLAGALSAINVEIVSVDSLGALRSGEVLLAAVIGGTGYFFGPVLGAIAVTLCSMVLARYTQAWQLYLGVGLAAVVLFAPGGLAGCVARVAWAMKGGPWGSTPDGVGRHAPPVAEPGGVAAGIAVHRPQATVGSEIAVHVSLQCGSATGAADSACTTCVQPVVLSARDLRLRFGRTEVLRGVDLELRDGEKHAVIGPNGAGKSSLFHVLSGLTAPSDGRVHLAGRDITRWSPHRINRLGLSRSFQVSQVFGSLSVFENLRCASLRTSGAAYCGWRPIARWRGLDENVHALLAELGLGAWARTPAGQLSYAEQRTLELGMALATDARVLLLDEPTAGMNRVEATRMVALIRRVCTGRALLIVEHDMDIVFGLADRISVMVQGEIIACGTPDAIRADARVRDAYLGPAPGRTA